jgi:hypothetical protein
VSHRWRRCRQDSTAVGSRIRSALLGLLIRSESIKQSVATRRPQLILTAPAAIVGGIPRRAVMVAGPGLAGAAARPVAARHVVASRKRRTVRLRSRQDLVPIGREATTRNHSALLVEHSHGVEPISQAVHLFDVLTHQDALRVMPRARADSIPPGL